MATRMPFSALGISFPMYRQEIKKQQVQMHMKRRDGHRTYRNYHVHRVTFSTRNSNSWVDPSPSDTIRQFYKCINEKNVKQLEEYISDDCFFEDFSFPKPFDGKKEVLHFLQQLISGMGQNLEFRVGQIYNGDDFIAGVNWHLEWKNKPVPFTRGCSLYRLSREGERLVIRKAQVFIESPIKPGDLVLSLLKIVTSMFDAFPEATEWFFRSQHVMLQLLLKIYSIFLVPFISPILAFYVKLGNFIVHFISLAVKILATCSRLFTKRKK